MNHNSTNEELKDLCTSHIDGVVEAPQELIELSDEDSWALIDKETAASFLAKVLEVLNKSKHPWRSACSLVKELKLIPAVRQLVGHGKFDVTSLEKFLKKNLSAGISFRESKDSTGYFWASDARLKEKKEKDAMLVKKQIVTEKERYALASLVCAYNLLHDSLDKYALVIAETDPHALSLLTKSLAKLKSGLASYGSTIHADFNKLPKITN